MDICMTGHTLVFRDVATVLEHPERIAGPGMAAKTINFLMRPAKAKAGAVVIENTLTLEI